MSHQITTAFINQYKSNVYLLSQQKKSRLEPFVTVESQDSQFKFYEQIGPVAAMPWGPRHGDTPLMETPHLRRRVGIMPFIWADLIDDPDRIRMLIEPTSPYATNAVQAFNRRKDDIIIQSLLGVAYTGHEGNVPVSFPSSQIVAESGGITIAKLVQIREMFWNNEVDEDEPLALAVGPNSIATMLNDPTITSADYNSVRALVRGEIDTFMGFTFIRTTRLPVALKDAADPTKGYVRRNIAWVKSGIIMSMGEDISVQIDKRADKKYSTQVFVSMDIGGVRMEEVKVVALDTLEMETPVMPAP